MLIEIISNPELGFCVALASKMDGKVHVESI